MRVLRTKIAQKRENRPDNQSKLLGTENYRKRQEVNKASPSSITKRKEAVPFCKSVCYGSREG